MLSQNSASQHMLSTIVAGMLLDTMFVALRKRSRPFIALNSSLVLDRLLQPLETMSRQGLSTQNDLKPTT